jgi:hypothetical protein
MGPRFSSAETQVCHRSYIIAAKSYPITSLSNFLLGGLINFFQATIIFVSVGLDTSITVGYHVEYRTAKKMTTAEMGRVVEIMMPTQHSEIAGA